MKSMHSTRIRFLGSLLALLLLVATANGQSDSGKTRGRRHQGKTGRGLSGGIPGGALPPLDLAPGHKSQLGDDFFQRRADLRISFPDFRLGEVQTITASLVESEPGGSSSPSDTVLLSFGMIQDLDLEGDKGFEISPSLLRPDSWAMRSWAVRAVKPGKASIKADRFTNWATSCGPGRADPGNQ
jgi:hypothetical protein